MRRNRIFWVVAVGIVVAVYFAAMGAVRQRIEVKLSRLFGRAVTVRAAHLTLPPGIFLLGVKAAPEEGREGEPSFLAQQVSARVKPLSLLQGRPGLGFQLTGPTVEVVRRPEGLVFSVPMGTISRRLPMVRLRVRDGKLIFRDTNSQPQRSWTVRNLSVSLRAGPGWGTHTFSALGLLEDSSGKPLGTLEASGELLYLRTAQLTVTLRDAPLSALADFVHPILGTAPQDGVCTLRARCSLHAGMLLAQNELSATGVVFPTEEPTVLGPSGNQLAQILQDSQGVIHLNFWAFGPIQGPWDGSDLLAGTLRESVRQALAKSIQRTLTQIEQTPVEEILRGSFESQER